MMDLLAQHEKAVAAISAAVKALHTRNETFRVVDSASETEVGASHGGGGGGSSGSGSGSGRGKGGTAVIDLSKLTNILSIDAAARMAVVEPNVKMGDLLSATLEHGLRPHVVIEFPETRIGRAFAGSMTESSSFKHGYFGESVSSIEMVLADGRVVNASIFENADLLKGAAGSMNTLGIVTKLEMTLVPAGKFVKATYNSFAAAAEMIDAMRTFMEDSEFEFIDGIIYSETQCVVITGEFVDEVPRSFEPQKFSGSWDPWFYQQVRARIMRSAPGFNPIDYIPITEYLFRYNRGGFWIGNEVFKRLGANPSNRFTRRLLNHFSSSRKGFKEPQEGEPAADVIIQDVSLPFSASADFITTAAKSLDIWPMWVCPVKGPAPPTFHPHSINQSGSSLLMLNIGIWGKPKSPGTKAAQGTKSVVQINRELEKWVADRNGRKTLCSPAYYTKEQFWKLYDNTWYEKLREKYGAVGLPTVYERITAEEVSQKPRAAGSWPSRFTVSKENNFPHAQEAVVAHQSRRI
ncbi:hypothetical protein jhhlp_000144 [Lomentospora prolificans]|uniref:Delta(24)-sterol reductase n=1 Tax=Lomentospora prolificans TaxID=41688 RepID=A0A2N3NLQ3_9PEZI|nr:hypothetical protein jhhlp_000144 [Lomentospora prolificans]